MQIERGIRQSILSNARGVGKIMRSSFKPRAGGCCLCEWRSPRDSMCAQQECRRKKQIDGIGKKHDMVWASPTTVSGFSGWSAGHSNRDGLRSGTKSCPLDCPTCHALVHDPLHQASAPKVTAPRENIICSGQPGI